MNQDLWVLCWSQRQNALHIETLEHHTSLNRDAYTENRPGDYRLLLVGTRAEVETTADSIRPTLRARARALPGQFPATNSAEAA